MIKNILKYFIISDKLAKRVFSPEEYARRIGVNIGKSCYIDTKSFSGEPYLITIGNNVRIAPGVNFFTHGGTWPFRNKNPNLDYFGKIIIKNNCYIGKDAKIMPGVTIEDDCIIGAGSVLTKSVPKGSIVAGNPAVYIGKTFDFLEKINEYNFGTKGLSKEDKKRILLSSSEKNFLKKGFFKIDK